ncbi:phage tail spike protein [Bacillus cereus]|uniref:phage tail spike protein n=1 Tax=Bacillus cereus TaxID=1396 RepID=UPI00364245A7
MSNNDLHIFDFKTEQIIAVIKEQDYWDDLRKWELKNNVDQFEFTVSDGTHKAAKLMQQNIVLKRVRDGSFVSYVINESEQDSIDRSKKIYALSEHTKLKKAKVIKPQTLEGYTVNQWLDFALEGTKWQRGVTEYASFRTINIKEFTNPLDLLKTIASAFELEIRFRTEVKGSFIVGRYVDMVRKVGRDNGKEIVLGKDLQGIRRIESSQDAISALVGIGPFNEETGEYLTFEKINGGKLYVADADALQRWTEDGSHKYDIYSPQTEDQNMSPERLKQLTEAELKKRINSTVKYEVTPIALEKIFGLSHEKVNKGNIVHIKDTKFTPPLFLEARLIAADECDTNAANDKYYFGDFKEVEDTRSLLDRMYAQVMGSLAGKANKGLLDKLEELVKETNEQVDVVKKESEAAKKLAEKVQENLKNYQTKIIESVKPPTTGLEDGKTLWLDISNGKPGILKLWKNGNWESVVPDVETIKKDTIEQVSKDIKLTKEELNKKVEQAQEETTGQFNTVTESLSKVTRTISDVQRDQGEIDKKVTLFEQDSNGFKTSIESLTKKDTEISNKLNTVESNVEGTKRAISDVQQTTSELKKTTTEIEEKAGKISEKLTNVETKVNSDKTGGRNLLLKSNVKYEKTDYLINQYSLTENFFAGEEYTFVIKGSVPQGQKFGIWQNGGSSNVGYAISVYANGITYVTFKAVVATSGNERKLSLYNYPSSTTKSIVEWVALYRGNKPQDWTAPPEEQVTTDEFTKKTTEIEKSVDGVKNTVTSVQNSQAGFEKRMTTVEQTATGLSFTVSNLNNVVSDQGKKLTEANSKLEQQETAIGAKVELKQVEDYVAGFKIPELKQTVDKNKQDLLGELANKLATEQFNQKMTLIDNRFTINEQGINASAKKTEVYTKDQANGQFATSSYVRDMETRLQLTEKGVSISVKENDVIAAFNMSKENITLNANRINLVGFITANHIKGKVLEGVTLKTSGNRFVEINKQDMKIFDSDKPRGYIGFMETNDGSIQPSLVLGSDNIKYRGTGSFYIYQVMPRINGVDQPSKAYAKFGVSKGENAEGTNIWSNYIQMQNDGGHLSVYSDGQFLFKNLNDIIFESEGWAPGYGHFFVTTTEPHAFTNNWGQFTFKRKGSDYEIHFVNGATDHDLIMGNAMIRSSFVQGYNNGLQIKDMMGKGWKDIELRTLRAQENVNANGQMWAKAFNPTSARNMKENIKDISFSALDKIMRLAIKQYNFKDDMYDLYQMRVNKPQGQTEPYTTKDIETYFGMIADDTEDIFTDKEKRAINLYNTVSIFIAAFQQQYHEFNEELTTVKSENKQLKEQVATLASNVSTLKGLVRNLIGEKPEQS